MSWLDPVVFVSVTTEGLQIVVLRSGLLCASAGGRRVANAGPREHPFHDGSCSDTVDGARGLEGSRLTSLCTPQ